MHTSGQQAHCWLVQPAGTDQDVRQAQRLEQATSLRGQLDSESALRQQLEDLQASSASLQDDNAALQVIAG